jgi:hypothetical protein
LLLFRPQQPKDEVPRATSLLPKPADPTETARQSCHIHDGQQAAKFGKKSGLRKEKEMPGPCRMS